MNIENPQLSAHEDKGDTQQPEGGEPAIGDDAKAQTEDKVTILPTTRETFCICGRQNDNRKYVMCENECDWYHPSCVGFQDHIFDDKVKFICPFCKEPTRARVAQLAERGFYNRVESMKESKKYFAYTPASAHANTN